MRFDKRINIRRGIGIMTGFYVIFILFMSWFYPYSFFSIHKSYSWESYTVYTNGKSYESVLDDFRTIHESDLQESLINGDIPNLTVSYTVGFLYFFEQDWLLSKDSVPMNEMQLHDIHLGLKSFRYNVLNLLAQENFSMEGKNYLVEMVNRIDSLEDRLHLLTSQSYVRSDLNQEFNHVYGEIFSLLNFYITFYENVMNGEFTPVN